MVRVAVLDYGVGNLRSIINGIKKLCGRAELIRDVNRLEDYDGIILPGVGAFKSAIASIGDSRMLVDLVREGKPILGICLGYQLLFEESVEGGGAEGLGLLEGRVEKIEGEVKLPHIGWNNVEKAEDSTLLENIEENTYFFFAHSYVPKFYDREIVKGYTTYGERFPSVIEMKNIYGTQFHPEKSSRQGLKVLGNFLSSLR